MSNIAFAPPPVLGNAKTAAAVYGSGGHRRHHHRHRYGRGLHKGQKLKAHFRSGHSRRRTNVKGYWTHGKTRRDYANDY